jgi:hypothetical protein
MSMQQWSSDFIDAYTSTIKVWEVITIMVVVPMMTLLLRLNSPYLPFSSLYDAETYLDWEMMVEQKFSSHLVPKQHKVRQATSELKDFAIYWWNGLAITGDLHTTCEGLKVAMHDHFVPPSYQHDMHKKLQCLEHGNNSVQDYYAELQKGMMHCGMVEETEDKICHFYGGLRHEIQDIVDYKEFNTINQLFQFVMLAEKELQGHQQQQHRCL